MSKFVVQATWDDVPHLSKKDKEDLYAGMMPHEREARAKGIPSLGSGAIYPVAESDIIVEPFEIPEYWPKAYGFDPGWNQTAAAWGAIDPSTGTIYLYSEYYRSKAEHVVHASAIKSRGQWIPGVIDYAGKVDDGTAIMQHYEDHGLLVYRADKSVDAGIQRMWELMSTGRLKVFSSLKNWMAEFRVYRRDDKGRIVKKHDHLMDASRYLIMAIEDIARVYEEDEDFYEESSFDPDSTTGY